MTGGLAAEEGVRAVARGPDERVVPSVPVGDVEVGEVGNVRAALRPADDHVPAALGKEHVGSEPTDLNLVGLIADDLVPLAQGLVGGGAVLDHGVVWRVVVRADDDPSRVVTELQRAERRCCERERGRGGDQGSDRRARASWELA